MTNAIPSHLRPALEAYQQRLRARFGERLREVRLFGSQARGDAGPDSDVDVLVVVDGLTEAERNIAWDETVPIVLETMLPLAALPLSSEKLAELHRQERLLARVLDDEGIAV